GLLLSILLMNWLMNWEKLISYSVLAGHALSPAGQGASPMSATGRLNQAEINSAYGRLPMSFELNQGQGDSKVRYLARGRGYQGFLTQNDTVFPLPRADQK